MTFDAVVIGAGLAGTSTALQLARRGWRVLLVERQRYPAHKLCGEFLSVEVGAAFERLGVREAVDAAGARPIRRALVTTSDGPSFEAPLPGTALGLSRYRLDLLLVDAARAAGVEVWDGTVADAVEGSLADGFVVEAGGGSVAARLVVGAYGKRGTLDRKLGRAFLGERSPLVAFKAHYTGLELPGVIELHAFRGGYCGLLPVEDGRVNACWITDRDALRSAGGDAGAMVETAFADNPMLARRFARLERVSDAFLSVSQLHFDRKGVFAGDVAMVGDTAAMIAPLCGDGMAMALHGAELLAPLAADFLAGRLAAEAFRRRYTHAWEAAFGGRLRLGRWLHQVYARPALAAAGVRACARWPALATWVIRATRG